MESELLRIKELINFSDFRTIKIVSNLARTDLVVRGFYQESRLMLRADFKDFQNTIEIQTTIIDINENLPYEYLQSFFIEENIKEADLINLFKNQYELVKEAILNSKELFPFLIQNDRAFVQIKSKTNNSYISKESKKIIIF